MKNKLKLKAFKRFINYLWFENHFDEPAVAYEIGNKRRNDENSNEDVIIKRKKTIPDPDAGIIHIDLTESPSDAVSSPIMPGSKRKKDKRNGSKMKDNIDAIEILDDEVAESSNDIDDSNSNDVEIVESLPPAKSLRSRTVSSPSVHIEPVKSRHPCKPESIRGSSGVQSYLTFSSVQIPNLRNIRSISAGSRTLKELNNKSTINSGYPSATYKKSASTQSSNVMTRSSTKQFKDKLLIEKMRKSKDRTAFLDLLKQYANSPEAKQQSLSYKLPVSSSKSNSSFDNRQSTRTFDTFDTKQSDLSLDSKKSNISVELPSLRRYSTRYQTAQPNSRSTLSLARKSAADKSFIDLTSEDDDEIQRQEIVSNVISSDFIRNLKTSFVGKDKKIAEEDYIYNILMKYEASMKSRETKAQKIQQQIRDQENDFSKILAERLEKRLILKEHELEEEVEQKPVFELAPITEAMTAAINQIVASKKVPLAQIRDTSVKLQDIRTLERCAWLNDEVINAYMNLIKMRAEAKPDKYPKVHCFNTFLYEQLQKKGYSSVRRWTKKIDIFDFNMLIIPIHLGNHWCLIQIQLKEKRIRYFDSMGSSNSLCLKSMMQYLVDEYKDKKNGNLDASEWDLINMPPSEIPQQQNMHDCGVFACTFAEHLTRLAPFNFSQDNMPYFRVKMMYEILTGELLV